MHAFETPVFETPTDSPNNRLLALSADIEELERHGVTPSVSIVAEMRRSYLDYAMSVIVARAIPDLRDGLKPVHRRILFAMHEGGYLWNRPYRKSARVVGDVIGRYHPHGDNAVYDALVRLAQPFSMRLPLLDGQGNFGSLDGDEPAAMRYTEIRLAQAAAAMLTDIDRDTVDFQDNYDGQDREPTVLPARIPNLLVNGAEGIAVGMATRIPPHNLGEAIDAALAMIEDPDVSMETLMERMPAPDFPTGGQIVGRLGCRELYRTGRGSILLRAKSRIEEGRGGRSAIIIDEVPFQVNKARLVEEISSLARERRVEGIAEVRDESDRQGVRVAIDLRRDATPEVVRNQLHRFTRMQTRFAANMIALVGMRPERLDLRTYLEEFLAFRETVVSRRAAHDLAQARDRAHVLCGLAVAVENIDEVVALIRAAPDAAAARAALRERRWEAARIAPYLQLIDDPEQPAAGIAIDEGGIQLSEAQVKAVLELRLQRLTGLGREEITSELAELGARIRDLLDILSSRERVRGIVADELRALREAHGEPRRTEVLEVDEEEIEDEALIEVEDMVVTVTADGYVKRTPLDDYRSQARGGKGLMGMATKEEDAVTRVFAATTHTPVLFFATDGMVYQLPVWRLPQGPRTGRGKALVNLLPVEQGVTVGTMLPIDTPREEWDSLQIVLATSSGRVRRNPLSAFANIRANGLIAMKLEPGVRLVDAAVCGEDDDIMLTAAEGRSIRFPVSVLRSFQGRASMGVRGMKVSGDDAVVSMAVLPSIPGEADRAAAYLKARRAGETVEAGMADLADSERTLLFVDAAGAGKRVSSHEFRAKGRGGQGVASMPLDRSRKILSDCTVVAAFTVDEDDEILLMTDAGQTIRIPASGVSLQGRTAGGVRLLRIAENERVVGVARVVGEREENGGGEVSNAPGPQGPPEPQED